jgi:hypothetical protein
MKKTIHHKWIKQNGYRTHQCERCGVVRYWDVYFYKLMYKTKWRIWYYEIPDCVMPNTKING